MEKKKLYFIGDKQASYYSSVFNLLSSHYEVEEYSSQIKDGEKTYRQHVAWADLVVVTYDLPESGFILAHAVLESKKVILLSNAPKLPLCVISQDLNFEICEWKNYDEVLAFVNDRI